MSPFWNTFFSTASLMAVCELGDKTFFITSIMSLTKSRVAVFFGSTLSMGAMTVVSIMLGLLTTNVPSWIIHYISVALFLYFGGKMLLAGIRMSEEDGMEEYEEAEEEVKKKENVSGKGASRFLNKSMLDFMQVFSMIFVAEWGDSTQISTILIAAKENVWAVGLGAFVGFSASSLIAVLGSRIVMKIISVKKMTIIGGLVFLLFGILRLVDTA